MDSTTKSSDQPQPHPPQPSSRSSLPKVFRPRNSLLTDLIANNDHIRTLHNWIISFVILVVLATVGDCLSNPERHQAFFAPLIRDLWQFFQIWSIMNGVVICLHYPLVLVSNYIQYRALIVDFANRQTGKAAMDPDQAYQQWLQNPERNCSGWASKVCHLLYALISIFGLLIYCPWAIVQNDLNICGSFALMMEMTRLVMKAHSFYIEKKDLRLSREEFLKIVHQSKPTSSRGHESRILRGFWQLKSKPRLSSLLYYMMAPTLLYRDSYPRTERIRWIRVLNHSFQFITGVYLCFFTIMRFFVENFSKTGLEPFQTKNLAHHLANMFTAGMLVNLLSFYILHHLWYNITGEVLRFADRQFYGEWWNAVSAQDFHRQWNPVVQEWLSRYVYAPIRMSFGLNRTIAAHSVIIISAIFHELIIAVSLRLLFPAMFFIFGFGNYLYFLMTKNGKPNGWQAMLYSFGNIMGWGLLCTLYSIEWYSRINCPMTNGHSWWRETLTPRLLNCVKFK